MLIEKEAGVDDESGPWLSDLLYALIGVVLGALAGNTIMRTVEIGGVVSSFIGFICGIVFFVVHFRVSCLGRLLQIVAAAVVTVIVMVGK